MSLLSVDVPPADVIGDALRLHLGPNALPAVAGIRVPVGPDLVLVLEVLAASHRVTVLRSGRPVLVETVACLTGSPLDAPPVDPAALPGAHAVDLGAGCYRFTSERRDGPAPLAEAARLVRALSGRGDALTVGFPGHPDALTGLAMVGAAPAPLAWSTWHLYPGADPHVVATTSVMNLREVA
jgi:hypothetical protein